MKLFIQKSTALFLTAILVLFFTPVLLYAQRDRFADIGNKAAAIRTHLLYQPQPPELPPLSLPVENKKGAAFRPMKKVATPDQLKTELLNMRRQFAPFLQNLAPALPVTRSRITIDSSGWRIETAADLQNFAAVLKGEGTWKKVALPHYGPPLGKAVTYYRTAFTITDEDLQKGALFIHFKGVDYKATVFVNGYVVGANEGSFIPFEFEISKQVQKGKNMLLVRVENDYPMMGHVGDDGKKMDGDKLYAATGMGYDDPVLGWHHNPPGMGINQQVYLEARRPVHVTDVFVRPLQNSDSAEVWLEVNNVTTDYHPVIVSYSLYGQNFRDTVFRNQQYVPETVHVPGVGDLVKPTDWEKKKLLMGLGKNLLKFVMVIPAAKRWNPDEPWLYQLQLSLLDEAGGLLDATAKHFGMRSFVMDTTTTPKGMMYLNQNPVRLRGANTMGNFMLSVFRKDAAQLVDDILLAKLANMNYLRMTQMPLQSEVYDYCDKLGMMTQSDLPLFGVLRRPVWAEAVRQAYEMEKLVRGHPCNVMVTYINERFPNAEGAPHRHLATYEEYERFFSAADAAVLTANPDRVIKAGDGDYDPPSPGLPDNHCYNFWYNGHGLGIGEMIKGYWLPVKPGWYYACGEFGSEGLDPLNTMQKYYPKDWLPDNRNSEWKPDKISQAQTARFHVMWFGPQKTIDGWIQASQAHQAEATRMATEAFRRDKRMVSFAIHLFIDAWPAGWMKAIMDVDRQPKPAYFAYRDALAPLAVQVRTDRRQYFGGEKLQAELWLCNDRNSFPEGSVIRYQVEQNGAVLWANSTIALTVQNSSRFQGFVPWSVPVVKKRTDFTLRAAVFSADGKPLHETSQSFSVFQKEEARPSVFVFATESAEASLLEEAGIVPVPEIEAAHTILVSGNTYQANKARIDAAMQKGKKVVVLSLSPGVHHIAGDSIKVMPLTMGKYYFVSRQTGHPGVNGFRDEDFKYWYEQETGMIQPLLSTLLQAEGWNKVLLTGNPGWTRNSQYAAAVAEKKWDTGTMVLSQLLFSGRLRHNPTAALFFSRLLQKESPASTK